MRKIAFSALLTTACWLYPGTVRADGPTLGGCIVHNNDGVAAVTAILADGKTTTIKEAVPPTCKLQANPDVPLMLSAWDVTKGTIALAGQAIPLGLCYGVTYQPKLWYAAGADFCLNVIGQSTGPTQIFPSFYGHALNWFAAGAGFLCTAASINASPATTAAASTSTPSQCDLIFLFGANVPVTF